MFAGYKKFYEEEYQTARVLIQHVVNVYPGHDATIEEVCFSYIKIFTAPKTKSNRIRNKIRSIRVSYKIRSKIWRASCIV
jgi:hypothetical protein